MPDFTESWRRIVSSTPKAQCARGTEAQGVVGEIRHPDGRECVIALFRVQAEHASTGTERSAFY